MSSTRPAMSAAFSARLMVLAFASLAAVSGAAQQATAADTAFATVSGTVYDSLSGRPLAGALVQVVTRENNGIVRSIRSDASGAFQVTGVPPGSYLIGFWHQFLDSLGLQIPPGTLAIRGAESLQVALAIPSSGTILKALCPAAQPGDSTGLLLGFIRDADTGGRLAGGQVNLNWTELVANKRGVHTIKRQASARSDNAGWFAQCGLSTAGPIGAQANSNGSTSGVIDITVPPRGLLHRDFNVPMGSAAVTEASGGAGAVGTPVHRGSAQLAGVVRDENGKPLSGARVIVWGSGASATTNNDGSFALSRLPAGTNTVETRYLGYAPSETVVDLTSNRTLAVTVVLDDHVNVLGAVTVYGKRDRHLRGLAGFFQRRAMGFGRFITQADIARASPARFTDILQNETSVKVLPTGDVHYTLLSTSGSALGGKCHPEVYINGARLVNVDDLDQFVEPADVTGVEIYNGFSETPAEFQGKGLCGTIVIWTSPRTDTAAR